jgi:Peptidase family M28
MATAQVQTVPHADEAWLRELVTELSAIHRPSASPGEREAAEWLIAQLEGLGFEGEIETSPAHGTYWWPMGLAAAAGAAAGIAALRGRRVLGAALAAAATAAAIDDLPPRGTRQLRRLLPQGERSQIVAEIGPPDADRTIVIHAHHDAPRSGLLYSPAMPELLLSRIPEEHVPDTSPPLMWPVVGGPLAVAAGAALGSRALTLLGTVVSAGTVAVLADIAAHEVVPGANDNATGAVALIALARSLAERPPEGARVLLLSTSEEATCDGMAEWGERHFGSLPRESTFFLSLDSLGSPKLLVLRGEGMLRIREYPSRSVALLDRLADELGIELIPNLRTRNATDGCVPLAAGYECASISSVTKLHQISNYHWKTDVAENVNYATVADGIRLAEATVRRLDERWLD